MIPVVSSVSKTWGSRPSSASVRGSWTRQYLSASLKDSQETPKVYGDRREGSRGGTSRQKEQHVQMASVVHGTGGWRLDVDWGQL